MLRNTQHATRNTYLLTCISDSTLNQSSFDKLSRAFFVLTTSAALSVYAYLGAFIRPIGDDYCISARLIGYNLLEASLYKYW